MNIKIRKNKIKEIFIFGNIFVFILFRILRNSFFYHKVGIGGIWNYISLMFIVMCFYIVIQEIKDKKISKLHMLCIFYIIYFITFGLKNNSIKDLKTTYIDIMYPFFIYVFISCEILKMKIEKINYLYVNLFYIITILNMVAFIFYGQGKLDFVMVSNVYYSLCLFPYILLNNRKIKYRIFKIFPIILLFTTLILSYKRTGIFGFLISGCIYLFFKSKKTIITKVIRILIVLIVLGTTIEILKNYLPQRYAIRLDITQIKKDEGSGRVEIYKILLKDFKNSSIEKIIFGKEKKKIEQLTTHDYAHNDFIEILYTRGVIGLTLFSMFYLYLIKQFILMYKAKYKYLPEYSFIMTINFFLSFLSVYFIDYGYSIVGASCTSFLIIDFKNKKRGESNSERKISNSIWS